MYLLKIRDIFYSHDENVSLKSNDIAISNATHHFGLDQMNIQQLWCQLVPSFVHLNCSSLVTIDNCKNKSFQTNFFLFFLHSFSMDWIRHPVERLAVPVIRCLTILRSWNFHNCQCQNSKHPQL